MNSTAWQLQRN